MRFGVNSVAVALLAQKVAAGSRCCTSSISRDVVVVGGGAAGSHAAVWLRDHDKSVVVIEKAAQLGGHTAFYKDPVSGRTINVGVQAWMDYKESLDFPRRMNVTTGGSMQFAEVVNKYIDFETGEPINWVAPGPDTLYPALQRYLDVLQKYDDILLPGFLSFPDELPEDLTMSFRDLVVKYDLAPAVPQIWDSTGMGLGRPMDIPALFMMQASAAPMIQALLGQAAAATPDSGRLWDLYDSVTDFLGDDVLYSSTIVSAKRSNKGVDLLVRGADKKLTCVKAKRLVVAAQPTPETVQPLGLSDAEEEVFDKINFATVYAGILQHPSLQVPDSYSNRSPKDGPAEYLIWPEAPQVGRIDWLGKTVDLFQFTAVGEEDWESADMKALIGDTIDTMVDAGTLQESTDGGLKFAAFADHGKMHPHVTTEDLKNGFIQKMVALQGLKSTWYTGAAFSAGYSTIVWEYNKVILPSVIEGI